MPRVIGICDVYDMEGDELHVNFIYAFGSCDARQAKSLYIDRDKFLDWEQFNRKMEDSGIRTTVDAGSVPKGSELHQDWEDWVKKVKALGGESESG